MEKYFLVLAISHFTSFDFVRHDTHVIRTLASAVLFNLLKQQTRQKIKVSVCVHQVEKRSPRRAVRRGKNSPIKKKRNKKSSDRLERAKSIPYGHGVAWSRYKNGYQSNIKVSTYYKLSFLSHSLTRSRKPSRVIKKENKTSNASQFDHPRPRLGFGCGDDDDVEEERNVMLRHAQDSMKIFSFSLSLSSIVL